MLIVLCEGYAVTEFQDGTVITKEVMGCQVNAIRKAIRPLFADLVTYFNILLLGSKYFNTFGLGEPK